jgi:hypothetical protein
VSLPIEDHQAPPIVQGDNSWRRRPAKRSFAYFLHLVFVGGGIILVFVGYNRWAESQPIAGGKTTTGTIISVQSGEDCGRYGCSPNYTPTIRFVASNGSTYVFVGPTDSSQVSVGDSVRVSYLPSNPNVAHDVSVSGFQGILLFGFGVFLIVLGLGSFILGFEAVHRRTGLSSAREGTGWVGHKVLHSNQGAVLAIAIVLAFASVSVFIL